MVFVIFTKTISMSNFHKLSVKKITRETEKSVSISFNMPENLRNTFAFKAGQYITLKTNIEDNEVRRDYSLCLPPKSGELKVAVKAIKDGTFSVYANTKLSTGDTIEVAPPKGRFIFEPNKGTKNIAAFAAGSGITPILSIVKTALEEDSKSTVVLVYGNKSVKDTMFFNELVELQNKFKERFFIQFVFSQTDEDNAIFGRIEKSTINYILKNKYKTLKVDAFYLCGPEAMITTTKDVLIENGISESKIYFELFKSSNQPDTEDNTNTKYNNTLITILVDDEETTFEMSQKQTILEAALDKDLDAPYSCQGGICSSCIAKVKEGKASMRQNQILTEKEVTEGLILTCQAHPITQTIVVDYDDA